MASMLPPHQTHFDYHYTTFPNLYQDFPTPSTEAPGEISGGGCSSVVSGSQHAMIWSSSSDQLESYPFPFFDHNRNDHYTVLPESDVLPQVPMMSASSFLSERHDNNVGAVMDMAVPVLPAADLQHLNMQGLSGFGYQNGAGLCEFIDDYCCGLGADRFKSISPSSEDTWGNQCNKTQSIEESNIKVGRYSAEERKDRILRYLKKRNQRNFNKTIKYACRKTLADRRVRVRGRFARNNETSEEETMMKKNVNGMPDHKQSELFFSEAIQLKHDDEDWLQEAMASLMYLPYA